MIALVNTFNQEKAPVGAFSIIIRTFVWTFVWSSTAQPSQGVQICASLQTVVWVRHQSQPRPQHRADQTTGDTSCKCSESRVCDTNIGNVVCCAKWELHSVAAQHTWPDTRQSRDQACWRLRWLDMVSKNRCNYYPVSRVSRVLWIAMVFYLIRESY